MAVSGAQMRAMPQRIGSLRRYTGSGSNGSLCQLPTLPLPLSLQCLAPVATLPLQSPHPGSGFPKDSLQGYAMIDFAAARRMMVDCQVRTSDVTDLRLIPAMLAVP